jgi:hypothetical protein
MIDALVVFGSAPRPTAAGLKPAISDSSTAPQP